MFFLYKYINELDRNNDNHTLKARIFGVFAMIEILSYPFFLALILDIIGV